MQHRWQGTRLQFRDSISKEWITGPDLAGKPGVSPKIRWVGTQIQFQNADEKWTDPMNIQGLPGRDGLPPVIELNKEQTHVRFGIVDDRGWVEDVKYTPWIHIIGKTGPVAKHEVRADENGHSWIRFEQTLTSEQTTTNSLTPGFGEWISISGPRGSRGPPGPKGDEGKCGPIAEHRWVNGATSMIQWKMPNGEWGEPRSILDTYEINSILDDIHTIALIPENASRSSNDNDSIHSNNNTQQKQQTNNGMKSERERRKEYAFIRKRNLAIIQFFETIEMIKRKIKVSISKNANKVNVAYMALTSENEQSYNENVENNLLHYGDEEIPDVFEYVRMQTIASSNNHLINESEVLGTQCIEFKNNHPLICNPLFTSMTASEHDENKFVLSVPPPPIPFHRKYFVLADRIADLEQVIYCHNDIIKFLSENVPRIENNHICMDVPQRNDYGSFCQVKILAIHQHHGQWIDITHLSMDYNQIPSPYGFVIAGTYIHTLPKGSRLAIPLKECLEFTHICMMCVPNCETHYIYPIPEKRS